VDPLKPKIKCIIAMSAHFESNGITKVYIPIFLLIFKLKVLKNKVLNTVHDHGFPEYYEFHYSPRGEPQIADLVYKTLI
jgi:aromatic ring-opening dioxygenase catalytic subunit (LigB family)